MDFSRARAVADHLVVLEETGSTNDELAARATASVVPEFTVVATLNQTAGRGRLDRTWVTPSGQALAVSVLLRPELADGSRMNPSHFGWIPLIAGLAMTRAVRTMLAAPDESRQVTLKWPNDVLIGARKVSGVLSVLLPDGTDVVVGAGLNLTIPADALPVPTATSLAVAGVKTPAPDLADRALARYLAELRSLWGVFVGSGGDALASGILDSVNAACGTLGETVRVSLPDGSMVEGSAIDVDDGGRLRVRTTPDAQLVTVAAGDVTHVRYE